MRNTELANKLLEQANGLSLLAEECERIVTHFLPKYRKCFEDTEIRDSNLAISLYPFAIERDRDAKRIRKEEQELRDAAKMLINGDN